MRVNHYRFAGYRFEQASFGTTGAAQWIVVDQGGMQADHRLDARASST